MLQQSPYVKAGRIKYVPKAAALKEMAKRYPDMVKNLTSNPFPNALRGDPEQGENVDKLFASLTGTKKPATSTRSPTARSFRTASSRSRT